MYILCGLVGGITLAAITIYIVRRRSRLHEKLTNWMTSGHQYPSEEYKVCSAVHIDVEGWGRGHMPPPAKKRTFFSGKYREIWAVLYAKIGKLRVMVRVVCYFTFYCYEKKLND